MDGLEQKIDKLLNTVEGIDKKLDGYIEFSSERTTAVEDKLDGMITKSDLQNVKQEIFDKIGEVKYKTESRINDHETRITNLETA